MIKYPACLNGVVGRLSHGFAGKIPGTNQLVQEFVMKDMLRTIEGRRLISGVSGHY